MVKHSRCLLARMILSQGSSHQQLLWFQRLLKSVLMIKPVLLENMIATVSNATVVILLNVGRLVLNHNATVGTIVGIQQDHQVVPQDAQVRSTVNLPSVTDHAIANSCTGLLLKVTSGISMETQFVLVDGTPVVVVDV